MKERIRANVRDIVQDRDLIFIGRWNDLPDWIADVDFDFKNCEIRILEVYELR